MQRVAGHVPVHQGLLPIPEEVRLRPGVQEGLRIVGDSGDGLRRVGQQCAGSGIQPEGAYLPAGVGEGLLRAAHNVPLAAGV